MSQKRCLLPQNFSLSWFIQSDWFISMAKTLSRAEVAIHNSVDDAWVIVNGSVYDVTPFLESHPGGLDVTEEHLGLDISNIMRSDEVHRHSITAFELLEQYNIGKINDEKVMWCFNCHNLSRS